MSFVAASLRLTLEPIEEACILRATGEIDGSTADPLRLQLDAARSDGVTTLLDLSGVSFMDSSGLGVLLEASEAADREAWAWFLVRPSAAVLRLVQVTKTAARLPLVMPNGDAGLAA